MSKKTLYLTPSEWIAFEALFNGVKEVPDALYNAPQLRVGLTKHTLHGLLDKLVQAGEIAPEAFLQEFAERMLKEGIMMRLGARDGTELLGVLQVLIPRENIVAKKKPTEPATVSNHTPLAKTKSIASMLAILNGRREATMALVGRERDAAVEQLKAAKEKLAAEAAMLKDALANGRIISSAEYNRLLPEVARLKELLGRSNQLSEAYAMVIADLEQHCPQDKVLTLNPAPAAPTPDNAATKKRGVPPPRSTTGMTVLQLAAVSIVRANKAAEWLTHGQIHELMLPRDKTVSPSGIASMLYENAKAHGSFRKRRIAAADKTGSRSSQSRFIYRLTVKGRNLGRRLLRNMGNAPAKKQEKVHAQQLTASGQATNGTTATKAKQPKLSYRIAQSWAKSPFAHETLVIRDLLALLSADNIKAAINSSNVLHAMKTRPAWFAKQAIVMPQGQARDAMASKYRYWLTKEAIALFGSSQPAAPSAAAAE